MKINRYLPFAYLYFFVNSLGLPFGLTYTALLAPLFYTWIIITRKTEVLYIFVLCLLPFTIIHFVRGGVDPATYLKSTVNLLLVYIFCQAFYTYLKRCSDPERIFRSMLKANFILCLLAIPIYFSPWEHWMWMETGTGIEGFRRLKMFTYEPSYYALIFAPLFLFFFIQYLLRQSVFRPGILLLMLLLPLVLSFSIGVVGAICAALFLTWLLWAGRLTGKRRVFNFIVTGGSLAAATLFVLLLFFRNNAVFLRLGNIYDGADTSGKGRTFDAFILAGKILQKGNEYWGVGLGQVQSAGEAIVQDYYLYFADFTVAIPNAVAETLAIFGWVGVVLRILLQLFFFFYTRVWTNYFRLSLFFFVFIYQFTGSFITNVAEYVIWILAFTNVFPQFNASNRKNSVPVEQVGQTAAAAAG